MASVVIKTAVIVLVLLMGGCGRGTPSGAVMEEVSIGLTMRAPEGWRIERNMPSMSWKGEGTGLIIYEPLGSKDFGNYVKQISEEYGGRVVSFRDTSVSGFDAIRAEIEYPDAGSKSLKMYINIDGTLAEVSFVTPIAEFAREERALSNSLSTIRIE